MPIIMFGSWCMKAGYLFTYDRVYTNTGRATPIVIVHFRHVGFPPKLPDSWEEDFER